MIIYEIYVTFYVYGNDMLLEDTTIIKLYGKNFRKIFVCDQETNRSRGVYSRAVFITYL